MADPLPECFPPTRRLHTASEFQAVFENGLRSSGAFFRLHFLSAPSPERVTRLGLAVPKKAAPLSVTRNRIKRLCREHFRQRQDLPAGDYVLVAQRKAVDADNTALRQDVERLLSEVRRMAQL